MLQPAKMWNSYRKVKVSRLKAFHDLTNVSRVYLCSAQSLPVVSPEDPAELCGGNIKSSHRVPALSEPQLDTCTSVLSGFLGSYFSGDKKATITCVLKN